MYSLIMLIMILYFGVVFCLNGFLFIVVSSSILNVWKYVLIHIHIYTLYFSINYAFQFLINKKMDEVVSKIYFSLIFLIALLMNTFLYCGAGELVAEQVSSCTIYTRARACACMHTIHRKQRVFSLTFIRRFLLINFH